MADATLKNAWDVFISHSSANIALARQVEKDLEADGLKVWLDDSEIRVGVLLADELRDSLQSSRVFVLLWSEPASQSRWIVSEILTAFHLGRFILPCAVDDTPYPYFLGRNIFLDLSRYPEGTTVERLTRAIRQAPDSANELPVRMESKSAEVKKTISALVRDQQEVLSNMKEETLEEASRIQGRLDDRFREVLSGPMRIYPDIVNLAGYHYKNAYMLKHWHAIQAGRPPQDPVLRQSEQFFFESLLVDPNEPSALNGVGSVLMLQRDLDAAEFFILRALDQVEKQGFEYPAAKHDLALVRYFKQRAD